MKSHTRRHKLREALLLTLLGALMYVSQVIMAVLPNIEIVSLLIILITQKFGVKSLVSVYIFVVLEALTYGFASWVVAYLYVWALLVFTICLLRKIGNRIIYALVSGIFGLLFGILCSPVEFAIGGFWYGISVIIRGLGFDLLHCAGNLVLTFLLYKPLSEAFDKAI